MPEPDAATDVCMDSAKPGLIEAALLHDLTRWRQQLARSIARNNLALHSEEIADSRQPDYLPAPFPPHRRRPLSDRCGDLPAVILRRKCLPAPHQLHADARRSFFDLFPSVHTRRAEQGGLMADLVIEESVMKKIVDQLSVSGPGTILPALQQKQSRKYSGSTSARLCGGRQHTRRI